MTKREMYAEIRKAVADNADMVAFIDHEVELLDKKPQKLPAWDPMFLPEE